jgi:hypothetical protein
MLLVSYRTHHTGSLAQPSATASTTDNNVSDEAALALLEQHNLQLLTSMSLIEWDLPRTYPTLGTYAVAGWIVSSVVPLSVEMSTVSCAAELLALGSTACLQAFHCAVAFTSNQCVPGDFAHQHQRS